MTGIHRISSDVFPSLADTFGIVMLEAMACGVPVAAFPVTGSIDVIENGVTGVIDDDLANAALQALELNPDACISYMKQFSWQRCAEIFALYLQPINSSSYGRLMEQNTCIENS